MVAPMWVAFMGLKSLLEGKRTCLGYHSSRQLVMSSQKKLSTV